MNVSKCLAMSTLDLIFSTSWARLLSFTSWFIFFIFFDTSWLCGLYCNAIWKEAKAYKVQTNIHASRHSRIKIPKHNRVNSFQSNLSKRLLYTYIIISFHSLQYASLPEISLEVYSRSITENCITRVWTPKY